jgi:hypothetical protein
VRGPWSGLLGSLDRNWPNSWFQLCSVEVLYNGDSGGGMKGSVELVSRGWGEVVCVSILRCSYGLDLIYGVV